MIVPLEILITHSVLILTTLFIGTLVYFHDNKSATNRALFVLLAATAAWAVANFFSVITAPEEALPWIRGVMVSVVWLVFFLYLFVHTFPKDKFEMKGSQQALLWSLFVAANILAPFVFTHINLERSLIQNFPYPEPHLYLMVPWGIVTVGVVIFAIVLAVRKYRQAEGGERGPLRAIFIGIITTFALLTLTQYIFVVVFKRFDFVPYGPLTFLPMVFGMAYAILRHHLFNIKVVATETLIFAIWTFLLGRIFFTQNIEDQLINYLRRIDIVLLFVVVIFGVFLIKSVLSEIRQKEKLQVLTGELNEANTSLRDLNENLQQKVDEQTIEIRKAYQVEKKAREDLEELDKAKDQFILTTQHHLRTPLTVVKGYIHILLNRPPQNFEEKTKEYLTKTQLSVERMARLINEFLGIYQLKIGKGILNLEPISLKKLVKDVLKELTPDVTKKNISITLREEDEAWPSIPVDTEKMREAIYILLDNAIKYNVDGGEVKITTQIKNHPIERNKHVFQLGVHDTGIGLTKEEIARLFVGFFERGSRAEEINTTGKGIGLSLARSIVQAHGGRIWAESHGEGQGSSFYFEIPRENSKPPEISSENSVS